MGDDNAGKKIIYITEFDKMRLEELITVADEFGGHARDGLDALTRELDQAKIVSSKDVPPDVVTMNSKVVVRDLNTSEIMTLVLVFPREANIEVGKISVLAPVGTAILGTAKALLLNGLFRLEYAGLGLRKSFTSLRRLAIIIYRANKPLHAMA